MPLKKRSVAVLSGWASPERHITNQQPEVLVALYYTKTLKTPLYITLKEYGGVVPACEVTDYSSLVPWFSSGRNKSEMEEERE